MAGLLFIADTEGEIALSAATAKTVLHILAPANQRLKVLGIGVFFDGVNVIGQPVEIRLLRQTDAGTMSSATPRKIDTYSETIQSTATKTATAEPSAGDVLDVFEVHPQNGYEKIYPLGLEPRVAGGGRIGLECKAPEAVNVRAKLIVEE